MIAVLLCLGCGPSALPPSYPSALLGKPMPKFKRRTIGGGSVTTRKTDGKIVVVKFFAKYCKPCTKTLPEAEKLYRANKGNIIFIGVAEDEYQAQVISMIKTYGLSFPIVHDRGNRLIGRFRTGELPATFVSDTTGVIRWMGGGGQGKNDLAGAVDFLKR